MQGADAGADAGADEESRAKSSSTPSLAQLRERGEDPRSAQSNDDRGANGRRLGGIESFLLTTIIVALALLQTVLTS